MPYWCVGQTEPRQESAAAHFLQLAGYRVFLPLKQFDLESIAVLREER